MTGEKLPLGKKIKALRAERGLTQAQLVLDGDITRNLLSQIENGITSPSLSTLRYIAKRLDVPLSYLVSDDDDPLFYEKKSAIDGIYESFKNKSYKDVIYKIGRLSGKDNELSYMLAYALFEFGRESLLQGALKTAARAFCDALYECEGTVFDTSRIKTAAPMYICVALNIQSPLLDFNKSEYESGLADALDYEFFKYLTLDFSYPFKNDAYRLHTEAKGLIKERRYAEALSLLNEAAELTKGASYNAFLIFGIYSDLEQCHKELYDFENAYLYANKRLSLLEGFKT